MEIVSNPSNLTEKVTDGLAQKEVYLPPEAIEYLSRLESGETDPYGCWRSDLVVRKKGSKIEGRGLFSRNKLPTGKILPGELLAIKAGLIIDGRQVVKNADVIQGSHQQIGPDEFLAGLTGHQVNENLVGYNHSCDPNARVIILDNLPLGFLISRKTIGEGKEITVDYSTCYMSETGRINDCNCQSSDCRHVITPGFDWMLPNIQRKYAGEFPDFMQRKIDVYNAMPPVERQQFMQETIAYALAEEIVRRQEYLEWVEGSLKYIDGLPDVSNRGYITFNRKLMMDFESAKNEARVNLGKQEILVGFEQYFMIREAQPYFIELATKLGFSLKGMDPKNPWWRESSIKLAREIDEWNKSHSPLVQEIA